MTTLLSSPRGMHDTWSHDYAQKHALLTTFRTLASRYGYEGFETPLVEDQQLFCRTAASSDIVTKEMFALQTRASENASSKEKPQHVLRPEGTAPLVRAVLQQGLTQQLPLKFFYDGPMFRYDRPQKGRLRQFHQIGIEHLGPDDALADVEILQLASHLLEKLGLQGHVTLHLNTLGDADSRTRYAETLRTYLTPHQEALSEDSKRRLEKNTLRILDSKSTSDQALLKEAPAMTASLTDAAHRRFEAVGEALTALGISYTHDTHLVRGLDYYTDTTFEFKARDLGAQSTVLAGGRFNGLSETLGGAALPGMGWAAGVERLLLLQQAAQIATPEAPLKVALLPVEETDGPTALTWAVSWRDAGLDVTLLSGASALPKRLKKAVQKKCSHALIVGANERATNTVNVKNLKTGTQTTCAPNTLSVLLEKEAQEAYP
jgi:histidyl-tRNA synthetase